MTEDLTGYQELLITAESLIIEQTYSEDDLMALLCEQDGYNKAVLDQCKGCGDRLALSELYRDALNRESIRRLEAQDKKNSIPPDHDPEAVPGVRAWLGR